MRNVLATAALALCTMACGSGRGGKTAPDPGEAAAGSTGAAAGAGGSGGGTAGSGGRGGASAMDAARVDPIDAGRTVDVGGSADATAARPGAGVNWTTQKLDNARTGWNALEKALTPVNVADVAKFGKLFGRPVEGQIYAQPLIATGLTVAGKVRNVVYVATEQDWVYAFDADDAAETKELWKVSFGTAPTWMQVAVPGTTPDLAPNIGITATPVIDLGSNTIFVSGKTVDNGAYSYKLHALDLVTGQEKTGSPVTITATVPATSAGSTGGMLTFDAKIHLNRPALLLQKGAVYIAFASHGDGGNYHGWVFGYDAATLKPKGVFVTNPTRGRGAGIWQSGNGLVGDGDAIYFATGNGFDGGTDPTTTPPQLGEAMVKLDNDLHLVDWHIRGEYKMLDAADADYGVSGPLLMSKTSQLIMGGKDSWALVYDKNNLGKYKANDTDAVMQKFKGTGTSFAGMHAGGFVYWEGSNGPTVYGWPGNGKLLGFKLVDRKFDETPVVIGPEATSLTWGDVELAISSNGAQNGIIWATVPMSYTQQLTKPGTLRAYGALDGKLLWHSNMMKARDDLGLHATYSYPTVANGKVYCPTWTGSTVVNDRSTTSKGALVVYGLLP